MNKVLSVSLFVILLLSSFALNAQQNRMIRDVVLINVEPYEVLMTPKGEIIARIQHLPDYLKSAKVFKREKVDTKLIPDSPPVAQNESIEKEKQVVVQTKTEIPATKIQAANSKVDFADHYEVTFTKGTATLSGKSLTTLNELADVLNSNPEKTVRIFGFQNESAIVASLLSKRRQDACLAYLRIKGVNVASQLEKGGVTKGTTNKIVFGFN